MGFFSFLKRTNPNPKAQERIATLPQSLQEETAHLLRQLTELPVSLRGCLMGFITNAQTKKFQIIRFTQF